MRTLKCGQGQMVSPMHGFLFAFKIYSPQPPQSDQPTSSPRNHTCSTLLVESLENLVHCITRSDIIHVEIIPVLGRHQQQRCCPTSSNFSTATTRSFQTDNDEGEEVFLGISPTAYSAYVGLGYNEHDSHFCITDPTYRLVYIPMSFDQMMLGIHFLHSQRGKKYNYFALPLTVLPMWCKVRKHTSPSSVCQALLPVAQEDNSDDHDHIHACAGAGEILQDHIPMCLAEDVPYEDCYHESQCDYLASSYNPQHPMINIPSSSQKGSLSKVLHNPDKVFCSQLGLTLCYLCNIIPTNNNPVVSSASSTSSGRFGANTTAFIDPMCCTPSELYKLLMQEYPGPSSYSQFAIAFEWPQQNVFVDHQVAH